MTVNEAAALLADIPDVQAIEVARLNPGDVIIISVDAPVSQEALKHIQAYVQHVWPGQKVLVLSRGVSMKVVRDGLDCPAGLKGEKGEQGRDYR